MQRATAGNVAAHNSPGGNAPMNGGELSMFVLLIGVLALIVITMSDDDNFGGHA